MKDSNIIEVGVEDVPMQDDEAVKADLEKQLASAKEQYEAKMKGAKDHFIAQCETTSEKYLTVNGIMQVMHTMREVIGVQDMDALYYADVCEAAVCMSETASIIVKRFKETEIEDYGTFLDSYLNYDFANMEFGSMRERVNEITEQLLVCQLLQNIGPALDDMLQFHEAAQAEIAKLEDELKAL